MLLLLATDHWQIICSRSASCMCVLPPSCLTMTCGRSGWLLYEASCTFMPLLHDRTSSRRRPWIFAAPIFRSAVTFRILLFFPAMFKQTNPWIIFSLLGCLVFSFMHFATIVMDAWWIPVPVAAFSTTMVQERVSHIADRVTEYHSFRRKHSITSFAIDLRHGACLVVVHSLDTSVEQLML